MSVASRPQVQTYRNAWIGLAIVALLAIAGLAIWLSANRQPGTSTVARRDVLVSLPLEGSVMAPPTARADVMSPYAAPVAKVYASVGDRVRAGEVLVELSYPSAQAAYDQARRELKAAETDLANARQSQGDAVATAKQQLEAARSAERRARDAGTVGAQTGEAGAAVAGQAPAIDLGAATSSRIEAEQALLQAQADLNATLAPYQQRLQAAQEAFRDAQAGRKMAAIRAPIAGTVLALNARPGVQIGDSKTPVATIVDLAELQVHAKLDPDDTNSVRAGTVVTLTLPELPGHSFEGKVTRLTTEPARTLQGQRFVAVIEFKNTQGLVKPGWKATASARVAAARNVLAVPSDAIDRDKSDRPVVETLRSGRWQKVVVEPGLSDGRYTAIRSGLNEGETIKVTPDFL
jgi:multidrug efflux pump subunit AcrA (membrane-fusion protein)